MSNISNIVKVYFPPGKYYADIKDGELFQYDTGQILELHGLNLPATVEVNFSIRNSSPTTDRIGHTINGITQVSIPNVLLEQSGDLKAYICVVDADAKSTEYVVRGVISRKPRSSGNISTDPSGEVDMLSKAIQTVNDCTVRSEVAKESAESAKDRVQSIASNFEQTANQSLIDINTSKTRALEAIQDNKAASVQTINDTGSAQVTEITDTGTAQVQAVQAEGATQVQAVQEAAAEIIADRQQIQANTSDISALSAGLDVSATAIIRNASGSLIDINDSAGKPLRGMSVYGKSRQNKTTGANLVDFRNVKTLVFKGLTISSDSDGIVTVSGTSTIENELSFYFTYYGKDVDLSLLEVGQTYASNCSIEAICSDGSTIWGKFTFSENIIRVRIYIQPLTSTTGATFNNVTYKPMLYKDTGIVPEWEPFTGGKPSPSPDYTQEIKNAGDDGKIDVDVLDAQLFDVDNADIVNMYISDGGIGNYQSNWSIIIPIFPNTNYTISEKSKNVIRAAVTSEYPADGIKAIFKSVTYNYKNIVIPSDLEDANYLMVQLYGDFNSQPDFSGVMLNKGSTALPWQPYRSQSLTLQTPDGLLGVPVKSDGNYTDTNGQQWICDAVDLERGVRVQRVGISDLKGLTWLDDWNKNPSYHIEGTFLIFTQYFNDKATEVSYNLHSHFTRSKNILKYPNTSYQCGHGARYNLAFRVPTSIASNVDEWKAYVDSANMTFTYVLATPTETPLTEEELKQYQNLKTYPGTTHIMTDDPVEPEIAVEYVADTEIWTRNLLSPLEDRIATLEQQALQKI